MVLMGILLRGGGGGLEGIGGCEYRKMLRDAPHDASPIPEDRSKMLCRVNM